MKTKTREERLWAYLSKKLGQSKTAKEVYHRIAKEFKTKKTEVTIQYNVDTRPLKECIKLAKSLTSILSKIRIK